MPDKRTNKVWRSERRNIEFILWRKKVDASMFYDKMILIPKAYERFWNISKYFSKVKNTKDSASRVPIFFEGEEYEGHIARFQAKKRQDYRISFGTDLCERFKDLYVMSFMRDLEFKLGREKYSDPNNRQAIEEVIPFWEFLDIEFDEAKKSLLFTCHYRQIPDFSYLFTRIADSTILQRIELELAGREKRVVGSAWHARNDLPNLPDVTNVIYYLLDEVNEELYVGKAGKSLKARIGGRRSEIPGWTHFRYDELPKSLGDFQEELELMIINALMHLCPCDSFSGKPKIITDFTLRNKKHIKKK